MVDLRGLEPLTSSMPWMRSSSCATGPGNLRYALILRDIGRTGKPYNPARPSSHLHTRVFQTCCSQASSAIYCSLAPPGCSLERSGLLLLLTACYSRYYTTTLCALQCIAASTVEMRGLEPLTSTVRLSRSSS